eukprot:154631-Heterocapsa_arctica.AAC.1
MEQLTLARREVEHARETARSLADAVRLTQAAEAEALTNQSLLEARLGILKAALRRQQPLTAAMKRMMG